MLVVLQILSLTFVLAIAESRLVKRNTIDKHPRFALARATGICYDTNTTSNYKIVTINNCLASMAEENYFMNFHVYLHAGSVQPSYYGNGSTLREQVWRSRTLPPVFYVIHPGACTLIVNNSAYVRPLVECTWPNYFQIKYYSATKTLASGIKEKVCGEFYYHIPSKTPWYGAQEFLSKEQCESATSVATSAAMEVELRTIKIAGSIFGSVTNTGAVDAEKNVIVSPLAMEMAAAVCVNGAINHEQTQTELLKAVFKLDGANALDHFDNYVLPLGRDRAKTFEMKNADATEKLAFANFFAVDTATVPGVVDGSFGDANFDSILIKENFAGRLANVAGAINAEWKDAAVAGAAAKDLIAAEDLDAADRVVLVNSLFAKLDWSVPFKSAHQADFYTNAEFTLPANVLKCRMMTNSFAKMAYGETIDMQWIFVPFKDVDFTMQLVLPRFGKTLDDLKGIDGTSYNAFEFIRENPALTTSQSVDVILPRFNINYVKADFSYELRAAGANAAFDAAADFSVMLGQAGVPLNKIRHAVALEVNEVGINGIIDPVVPPDGPAPTATPNYKQFVADHSFLFFITARKGDRLHVLFSGQFYNDPQRYFL